MAPIPKPIPLTIQAIYDAYVEDNNSFESIGIPAGSIGKECSREIWYDFRYASDPENIDGRKIRIFRRGDIEELRIIDDLRRIGYEVTEQQTRVRAIGGHIRGKIDGQVIGVIEAPATEHLLECKSSNDKNFKLLVKDKVQRAKPDHYATMQFYMHQRGLTRALYVCNNKNDEQYHIERVEYDASFAIGLLAKGERIVKAEEPPARISEDPKSFQCMFCKHPTICHGNSFPRVTCRSCLHATAELGGDAHWSCARWNKPLSLEEQKTACPAHLFLPGLVPGKQVDANEEDEWVEYELRNGKIWRDGAKESNDNVAQDIGREAA